MKKIIFLLSLCVAFSFATVPLPAPLTSADMPIIETEETDLISTPAEIADEITAEADEITTAETEHYSVAEPVVATNAEEEETAEETTELDTTAYDFVGNITANLVELSETTSLKISSDPEGATILVNRRISGTTPFYAEEIEAGEYNIMLLKEGFALFDTTITLSTGQHLQFTKNLSPENQQAQPAQARAAQNRNEADQADTAATISDEELAQKRRRMDKIGIIVFLSVMFISMTMQEARNR